MQMYVSYSCNKLFILIYYLYKKNSNQQEYPTLVHCKNILLCCLFLIIFVTLYGIVNNLRAKLWSKNKTVPLHDVYSVSSFLVSFTLLFSFNLCRILWQGCTLQRSGWKGLYSSCGQDVSGPSRPDIRYCESCLHLVHPVVWIYFLLWYVYYLGCGPNINNNVILLLSNYLLGIKSL